MNEKILERFLLKLKSEIKGIKEANTRSRYTGDGYKYDRGYEDGLNKALLFFERAGEEIEALEKRARIDGSEKSDEKENVETGGSAKERIRALSEEVKKDLLSEFKLYTQVAMMETIDLRHDREDSLFTDKHVKTRDGLFWAYAIMQKILTGKNETDRPIPEYDEEVAKKVREDEWSKRFPVYDEARAEKVRKSVFAGDDQEMDVEAYDNLDFGTFRSFNEHRCEEVFFDIDHWSETDWGCALAGEVGELCNMLKKRLRGTDPVPNIGDIANEMGDVFTYLDHLANRAGIDLGRAVRARFNEVSERTGFDIELPESGI